MSDVTSTSLAGCVSGQHLQALAERLASVDCLTEQAFLLLGEQVREGHRRSALLTDLAGRVLQAGDGESAEQTIARLQLLTERGALWLAEAHDQSRVICAILDGLERDMEALAIPLRGLAKVAKILQALRVATRIEAARGHAHGALALGQELRNLGARLQERLALVTERYEVLATLRRRAAGLEEQAQAGSLHEAEDEIRQARLLLGSVAAQCVRNIDQTAQLRLRSAELAENFGELVAALQFQDITRQRLQHIGKALEELSRTLLADSGVDVPVGEICLLQHDQLTLAAGEFCEAIARLDENLRGMADSVQLLTAGTRQALFAGSNEQCARIAPSLQAVAMCLEKVQTANLAAGQAVFAVCQAVHDVAALTGEIEQLGEEMQLLAQNAAVSAAHGSVRAAGLTVIAGSIQTLAEDAGRHAVAMTDCCRRVSGQAGELDANDQRSDNRDANLGTLLDEARRLIDQLEGEGQALDAQITLLGRQAAELGEAMRVALVGLGVRWQFLAQVQPVLDELGVAAVGHGNSVRAGGGEAMLGDLQYRYTMMSERDVHQRFLHRHAGHRSSGDRPAPVFSEGDLGSNVELF